MIEKKLYIAVDGKEFDNSDECIAYEKQMRTNEKLFNARDLLKEYCRGRYCDDCVFGTEAYCVLADNSPNEW